MHLNFVVEQDGRLTLAVVFTDATLSAVALTADGRILADGFYIMPSTEEEFLSRNLDAVRADGFPTQVLEDLRTLVDS